MDFLSAAYHVLEAARQPLHYIDIAKRALDQGLLNTTGATPEATMGSRLYVDTKKEGSRFERAGRGMFAIRKRAGEDGIARQVNSLNDLARRTIRERLYKIPPDRFQTLISELMLAIGFDEDTVHVMSYSGDGGVDVRGVLSAGNITAVNAAVQVKRWRRKVQAPTVRNLRGSLTTSDQGILVTTSDYSKGAKAEANAIGKTPISLINGAQLVDLLVAHKIGVTEDQYSIFSLDQEYWAEIAGEELAESPGLAVQREVPVVAAETFYPIRVRAINKPELMGELLDVQGRMSVDGNRYASPSAAGRHASGWKSCNGWKYWQYQRHDTHEWRPIDELRKQGQE